jgi:hypothetical protein
MKRKLKRLINYIVFINIIILILLITSDISYAEVPCTQTRIDNGNVQYWDDWQYDWGSFDDCRQNAIVITRGDENDMQDFIVTSRDQFSSWITIWAAVFFPGIVILILRAIV